MKQGKYEFETLFRNDKIKKKPITAYHPVIEKCMQRSSAIQNLHTIYVQCLHVSTKATGMKHTF